MPALLERMFRDRGQTVEVLNAGVGNYNAERYAERYLTELADLDPTDILVHFFLRDAEVLEPGGGNWLMRNSELAVMLWLAAQRTLGSRLAGTAIDRYRALYRDDAPGHRAMLAALDRLAADARAGHRRLFLAMVPDLHSLEHYPLVDVHARMRREAEQRGFVFVDLLPALAGLKPEEVWAMRGDPHPNALGHRKMAEAVFPVLAAF